MKIKNWLIHKLGGISKEELFLPVQYTVYRPKVKKINEHDQFFKVKCGRCGSYLLFERKDEMKNWYEDMKIWWVPCPECNNHVTTYEIVNGKPTSHIINE